MKGSVRVPWIVPQRSTSSRLEDRRRATPQPPPIFLCSAADPPLAGTAAAVPAFNPLTEVSAAPVLPVITSGENDENASSASQRRPPVRSLRRVDVDPVDRGNAVG
jgi:hypothetical protein